MKMNGKRILKVLANALVMSTMWTSVAQAAPLTLLLFGAPFATSILGGVVSWLFGVGITAALTYASNAIFGNKDAASATDAQDPTQIKFGERVPRSASFGSNLQQGHWVHANEFQDATRLQLVYILGDGWHAGLESTVKVNGKQYDLISVTPLLNNEAYRFHVDTFDDLIDIRVHDGHTGQGADTEIITQTPDWDTSRKYTNMFYVAVTVISDKAKFNGIPDFEWVSKGLMAYDPRKDDTAGGAGTHRFADSATWEYSKNPAVLANHYMRGFYYNSKRFLGAALNLADIDFSLAVAAMNVCDESIMRPDGSFRPRYEVNTLFDDTTQYSNVLQVLCEAMGGFYSESQGRIGLFAGKAQSSVMTFTDDDLIRDEDITFDPKRQGIVLYTGIQGTYISPLDYSALPYAATSDAGFIAEDGGEHFMAADFTQVQDPHQAFLLSRQKLFANRYQATGTVTLDIKDMLTTVGDWVTWNSQHPLRGNRIYKVVGSIHNLATLRMTLNLEETNALVFDDTATTEDIAVPTRGLDFSGYLREVAGFGITVVVLEGGSGEQLPALLFNYDSIQDPAVRAVDIEYRVVDAGGSGVPGPTIKVSDTTVSDGQIYSTQAVTPGKIYEARARLNSLPGREYNYTDWVEASVPTGDLTTIVTIPDNVIDLNNLVAEIRNTLGVVSGTDSDALAAQLDYLLDHLDDLASAVTTNSASMQRMRTLVQVRFGTAIAAVIHEQSVRASAIEAVAEDITQVIASLGSAFAQGLFKINATVGSGGPASSTILLQSTASLVDSFAQASIQLQAVANGLGASLGTVSIVADRFFFLDTSGNVISAPFSIEAGIVKLGATRAGRIQSADGTMYIDFDTKDFYMEA